MSKLIKKAIKSKTNLVSYFKNARARKPMYDVELSNVIEGIKKGRWSLHIEKLRELSKSEYDKQKKQLPCFTVAATFAPTRKITNVKKANGCIVLDIDKLPDLEATEKLKNQIVSKCDFINTVFVSPSNKGLKIIVQTDNPQPTDKTHKQYFKALETYFKETFGITLDTGNDISRLCFVSHDPNLYHNPNAQIFTMPIPTKPEDKTPTTKSPKTIQKPTKTKKPTKPTTTSKNGKIQALETNKDTIFQGCIKATESKGIYFAEGQKHNFVLNLACACNRYGLTESDTITSVQNQYGSQMDDPDHHTKTIKDMYKRNQSEHAKHEFKTWQSTDKTTDPPQEQTPKPPKNDNTPSTTQADTATVPPMAADQKQEKDEQGNKDCFNDYYEFGVKKGCYYVKESLRKGNAIKEKRISNFTMSILYHLKNTDDPNNSKRILQMQNRFNDKQIIEITTHDLVSLQSAKSIFSSQGNFTFKGNGYDLNNILEYNYENETTAQEIKVLGLQPESKVYAFANGVNYKGKFLEPDTYGIIKGKDQNFYLPTANTLNSDNKKFEAYQKFRYAPSKDISFKKWSNLINTVYGINGRITICYLIACLFRDYIFNQRKFFPHLFLYGESGAGKSKHAESFMALFGKNIKPLSIAGASTPKAFLATLSQFRNAMIYFEEYKNNVHITKVEALKDAYNGYGYTRRTIDNSNTTVNTPVLSGCFIAGQELPTKDIALLKRCMLSDFFETTRTTEEKRNYDQLKEIEKQHGLSNILTTILQHRDHFVKHFESNFFEVSNSLKKYFRTKSIEDRLIENYSVILAALKTMESKLDLPFSYEDILKEVTKRIKSQNETINNTDELARFWDIVHHLMNDGHTFNEEYSHLEKETTYKSMKRRENTLIEDKDYTFHNFNNVRVVCVRYKAIFAAYSKEYFSRYKTIGLDEATLKGYIMNDSTYVPNGEKTTIKKRLKHFSTNPTTVYMFDYQQLESKYFEV